MVKKKKKEEGSSTSHIYSLFGWGRGKHIQPHSKSFQGKGSSFGSLNKRRGGQKHIKKNIQQSDQQSYDSIKINKRTIKRKKNKTL